MISPWIITLVVFDSGTRSASSVVAPKSTNCALVSEPSCTHGSTARVAPLAVCTVARTWALLGLVSVVRRPTTRSFRPARVRSADTSIAVEAVKVVVVLVVFALAILWYARE